MQQVFLEGVMAGVDIGGEEGSKLKGQRQRVSNELGGDAPVLDSTHPILVPESDCACASVSLLYCWCIDCELHLDVWSGRYPEDGEPVDGGVGEVVGLGGGKRVGSETEGAADRDRAAGAGG